MRREEKSEYHEKNKKKVVKILDKGYSMVVYLQRGIREENLRRSGRLKKLRRLRKLGKLRKLRNLRR